MALRVSIRRYMVVIGNVPKCMHYTRAGGMWRWHCPALLLTYRVKLGSFRVEWQKRYYRG